MTKNNKIDQQPKRNGNNGTTILAANNTKNGNLGSKFQDVQRKWMLSPPPMGESDSSDLDPEPRGQPSSLPLGHSSVKSLSNKFQQNGNGVSSQNGQNGYVLILLKYFLLNKKHMIIN